MSFNEFQRISTNKDQGFTLVEMIVSVGLFTVVMLVSIGAVLAIVDADRKAQALKSVMDNLHFTLQGMTFAIQTGKDYDCKVGVAGTDCAGGGTSLYLRSADAENVVYEYDLNLHGLGLSGIKRKIDTGAFVPITAPEVKIESFKFYVVGTAPPPDTRQPLVIITLEGRAGASERTESSFFIQTSVSQRAPDD